MSSAALLPNLALTVSLGENADFGDKNLQRQSQHHRPQRHEGERMRKREEIERGEGKRKRGRKRKRFSRERDTYI